MEKKRGTLKVLLVFGALVLIAAVMINYIMQLNQMVSTNTLGTITELAEHDQSAIRAHIETNWENLENIGGKFKSSGSDTAEKVEMVMNIECSNSRFTHIYAVTEEGFVYTDTYETHVPGSEDQRERFNFLPYFENGEERVVARFDDCCTENEPPRESILYGVKLQNCTVDGKKIVGLIGISNIRDIQGSLVIKSFIKNGVSRGYSAVIDRNGEYVVNVDPTEDGPLSDNFYERITAGEKSDLTVEEITEKMEARERFHFYFVNREGTKKLACLMPLEAENVDWYFLMSVDNRVFIEQSQSFFKVSLLVMSAILLVVVLLIFIIMSSQRQAAVASADARARSEFLSNMSHEIRTPLNGIVGLIHLMEKDFDNPEGKELMRSRLIKARGTTNYLLALVNDILDMSKLQAGKVDLVNEPYSPEMLMDAVWSMQKGNTENAGVELIVKKDITVPWVMGDETRVKQVLMNIVGNAAKFTPKGGRIVCSVSQKQIDARRAVTVYRCEDTGIGMSEEFMTHIWDSFSQERNKNSDGTKGTGLGMAICKLLVDAMGGEISVKSKLGEGSAFTVTLPSEIAESLPEWFQAPEEIPEDMPDTKILVAEDNELNAEILMDILASEGLTAVHARNGEEALEIFKKSAEGEFGYILMDMQMPVMDGCEAASWIRKLNRADAKKVTIFACTANTFKEDKDRAAASGMNDFLSKPIDVKVLLEKIGRAK